MKNEYRNKIRTNKLIREAMISLLAKKKDVNLITISDVVREADINRGTFYNHYNNLSDVINEIEDELMDELTKTMNISMKENNSLVNFIYTITNHLKANEASYKTICAYIPKYIMDDMKKKVLFEITNMFNKKNEEPSFSVPLSLIANGLVGTYLDYFEGRLTVTLDELALFSIRTLNSIVDELIGKNVN